MPDHVSFEFFAAFINSHFRRQELARAREEEELRNAQEMARMEKEHEKQEEERKNKLRERYVFA